MPEFVAKSRADLGQSVIDELHAQGVYLGHGGEAAPAEASGLPMHRLFVDAGTNSEALAAARSLLATTGVRCRDFSVEEPPLG